MLEIDEDRVIETYHHSGSARETAEKLGMRTTHVQSILRRHRAGVGQWTRQRKCDWDRVVKMFQSGMTTKQIAEHFGMNHSSISRILKKKGFPLGQGRKEWIILPIDEIASRYLSGESCSEIAVDYHVTGNLIRRKLKANGIARRSAKIAVPKGKKAYQYKHGRKYNPMHYYRRQSYEIAAICMGQPIPSGTIIHHMNENPNDNRPENLALFPSAHHHAKFHQQAIRLQRSGLPVDTIQLVLESGGQMLPQPPAPIVFPPYIGQNAPLGIRKYRRKNQKVSEHFPLPNVQQ